MTDNSSDDNPFKPMAAAGASTEVATPRQTKVLFAVALIVIASFSLLLFYVLVQENSLANALEYILPAMVLAILGAALPAGEKLGWRQKYWTGFRIVLIAIALVLVTPWGDSKIGEYGITALGLLVGVPYFIEMMRRRANG